MPSPWKHSNMFQPAHPQVAPAVGQHTRFQIFPPHSESTVEHTENANDHHGLPAPRVHEAEENALPQDCQPDAAGKRMQLPHQVAAKNKLLAEACSNGYDDPEGN